MRHPAFRHAFADLARELQTRVDAGLINTDRDGDLVVYSYSRPCTWNKSWDTYTRMARGLVLDHAKERVAAAGFPKFFNAREPGAELPEDESFTCVEKLDGSLAICFLHEDRPRAITRGNFQSEQARAAQAMLPALASVLTEGETLLCELLHPVSRVVVPYESEELVLLGGYHGHAHDGAPMSAETLDDIARKLGLRRPRIFPYKTLAEVEAAAAALPATEEGFVLTFASGRRVKVKGEEYIAAYRAVSRCRPLDVWELLATNQPLAPTREMLPEEMYSDFDAIARALHQAYQAAHKQVLDTLESMALTDRKSAARSLQGVLKDKLLGAAFAHLDGNAAKLQKRLWEHVRPDGNVLPGYEPSRAVNRFEENADS